jgi:hypothetical protein
MNQRELIIKYLHDFGSISDYEAVVDLGILQFGARLKELREQGYNFSSEWVNKKNRYGKPVRFKRYKLEETNDKFCH